MGSRREAQRRCPACGVRVWRGSWQATLLAASILSSCFLLNQAQSGIPKEVPVTWKPLNPIQGQNVTLTPGGGLENVVSCNWYRGRTSDLAKRIFAYYLPPNTLGQVNGSAHTGRETGGPDCSLHIMNLTSADSGNYTVVKDGPAPVIGYATIEVSDILAKPNVSVFPSPFLRELRDSATLTCGTTYKPVSIRWFWKEEPLHSSSHIQLFNNNQTLFIQVINRTDAGAYHCQVSNPASNKTSDIIKLTVFYGPDMPAIQPLTNIYSECSDINLSCNAVSFPDATYTWFVNGTELNKGPHLFIQNITWKQAGNYTCQATNAFTDNVENATLEIVVVESVTNVIIEGPSTVFENNMTVLNCTSTGSKVSYYWLKGNQSLEVGEHISLSNNNQTLMLNTTRRSDSGIYTCYGNNSFSSGKNTHSLIVFYGPDVPVISPSMQYYGKGSNLTLSCKADSTPSAQYTWNKTKTGDTFQLFDLSLDDSGNYTCEAYNNETLSTQFATLEIWVLEILSKPILTPDKNRTVESQTVILQCKTSSNPKVIVSWFKDGKPFPDTAKLSNMNRTLTLPNITKDDAGNYTCEASNPVSSAPSNSANIVVAYGPNDVHLNQSGTLTMNFGSNLALLCIADSFPVQFRWFFNDTDQEVAKDTFSVPLKGWENQGNYTCQAYNSETNRTGTASVMVKLEENASGNNNGHLSGGAIAGIVIGCVAGVVLISGLVYFLCVKSSLGRTEQQSSNGNIPSAPGHNQGVTDTKNRSGEEDVQYSTLAFNANNPPQPAPGPTQPLESNIIYSEIKKK